MKPVLPKQNEGAGSKHDGGQVRPAAASVVLYHCVSTSLVLLSPLMPFLTEELWQRLQPFRSDAAARGSLCLQPYPRSSQLVLLRYTKLNIRWIFPILSCCWTPFKIRIHLSRMRRNHRIISSANSLVLGSTVLSRAL